MKKYGYMRVSSIEQNEDRQRIQLLELGIEEKMIFCDKVSGKDFNRPEYKRMRQLVKKGDLVAVTSIDRLGRNYNDILEEWRYLTKEKGADIIILDMPLLDTRQEHDLMGTLITDIVLQLLSYVAQVEREHIRRRQAEGIAAAKARGVHLGRRAEPIPDYFPVLYGRWKSGELRTKQVLSMAGLTSSQFYWMVHKYERQLSVDRNTVSV